MKDCDHIGFTLPRLSRRRQERPQFRKEVSDRQSDVSVRLDLMFCKGFSDLIFTKTHNDNSASGGRLAKIS